MLSRFDYQDPLATELRKKLQRAFKSPSQRAVKVTQLEFDLLIGECGGADPDYTNPQNMYTETHDGVFQSFMVRNLSVRRI